MNIFLKFLILLSGPVGWLCLIFVFFDEKKKQAQLKRQQDYFDSLCAATHSDLNEIDSMRGHEFEHFVARVLSKNGYSNVSVTSGSKDFGVDIFAYKNSDKYAIQVKRQNAKISRKAVSDALAGAAHFSCNKYMVVTNSYMSASGLQFARSVNCNVIERDELINMINFSHIFDLGDAHSEHKYDYDDYGAENGKIDMANKNASDVRGSESQKIHNGSKMCNNPKCHGVLNERGCCSKCSKDNAPKEKKQSDPIVAPVLLCKDINCWGEIEFGRCNKCGRLYRYMA